MLFLLQCQLSLFNDKASKCLPDHLLQQTYFPAETATLIQYICCENVAVEIPTCNLKSQASKER